MSFSTSYEVTICRSDKWYDTETLAYAKSSARTSLIECGIINPTDRLKWTKGANEHGEYIETACRKGESEVLATVTEQHNVCPVYRSGYIYKKLNH